MIAIVDYGSGNMQSVVNTLNDLKCDYIVTSRDKMNFLQEIFLKIDAFLDKFQVLVF